MRRAKPDDDLRIPKRLDSLIEESIAVLVDAWFSPSVQSVVASHGAWILARFTAHPDTPLTAGELDDCERTIQTIGWLMYQHPQVAHFHYPEEVDLWVRSRFVPNSRGVSLRPKRLYTDQVYPIRWSADGPAHSGLASDDEQRRVKPFLDAIREIERGGWPRDGGRRPLEEDDTLGWREAADRALARRKKGATTVQSAAWLGIKEGTLKRWIARRLKELRESDPK